MDVQRNTVSRLGERAERFLAAVNRATKAARSANVPVIYVRVAFRQGAPEISPRNKTFAPLKGLAEMGVDDPQIAIHPEVAPEPTDIVVVKTRISALAGTDLEVILRSLGVRSLVLSGIATSGCVLSTLRQAADLDYQLTVLSDSCDDGDPEVHRFLVEKLFPRQADVVTTDEWIARSVG